MTTKKPPTPPAELPAPMVASTPAVESTTITGPVVEVDDHAPRPVARQGEPVSVAVALATDPGPERRTPHAWAKSNGVDPSLVEGAAVLAGWPAGNLREGSIVVTESEFNNALEAFAGLEIG
jgi:hypothetical protein